MNGPEIVRFSQAVYSIYLFNELSTLLLGMNRPPLINLVPALLPFPQQVEHLVGVANSEGWIAQLVMAVIADRGQTQAVRDFLTGYPDWDASKNPPLKHPADTLKVFGGRSFIGRDDLREFLKKMESATGKKLLVVTAEKRKVGKTYSKDLVDFLSFNRQPSEVVYLDLDSADFDPLMLTKKLGERLRVDLTSITDPTSQQAARSSQELVSLLIPDSPNPPPKVWWIILDGFRQKGLSEATREFIDQLAQRIQTRQDFRLLLLNYTYSLTLAVSGFAFKEKVEPLGSPELEVFLSRVHANKFKAGPSPAQLAEYMQGVIERHHQYKQDYPEYAEDQLLLNMAVTDVADAI